MFMLVYEWINETDGSLYEQSISWFDTKEELLEAYKKARKIFHYQVNIKCVDFVKNENEYCYCSTFVIK